MTVALQSLLILVVGAFVLAPMIRLRGQHIVREAAAANQRRSIDERKTRLLRQLADLDFDRDSGKISPEDHGRMREETMAEVLQVYAEEERLGPAEAPSPASKAHAEEGLAPTADRVERLIEEMKRRRASMEATRA